MSDEKQTRPSAHQSFNSTIFSDTFSEGQSSWQLWDEETKVNSQVVREALHYGIDFIIAVALLTIVSTSCILTVPRWVVLENELLLMLSGHVLRVPYLIALPGAGLIVAAGMLLASSFLGPRRSGWSVVRTVLGATLIANGAILAGTILGLLPPGIVTEVVRQPPFGALVTTCVVSLGAAASLRHRWIDGARLHSRLLKGLWALAAASASWGLIRWIDPQGHDALLGAAVILHAVLYYWRSALLRLMGAESRGLWKIRCVLFAVVFLLVAITFQWQAIRRADIFYARGVSLNDWIELLQKGRPNLLRWRILTGSGMTYEYKAPFDEDKQAWKQLVQYALAPTLLTSGDSAEQVLVHCPTVAACLEYEHTHHVQPLVTVIPYVRLYPREED